MFRNFFRNVREIHHLNKERLLNGIQKLSDRWQVCVERGRDSIEGLQILFRIIINTFESGLPKHYF